MKKLLTNNLALKILSVVIAIVIWYVVVDTNDPKKSQSFMDVPIQVVNENYIANGKKAYLIDSEYQQISVVIRGNKSKVEKIDKSEIIVTADLTQIVDMNTNPVYVPLTVTCPGVSADEISLTRKTIPVTIEDITQATFAIETRLKSGSKPGKEYEVGKTTPNPESVTLSGPESIVNRIGKVTAEIDVAGMTADGVKTADVKIFDKNGDQLESTYLSKVPSVDVAVTLWKKRAGIKIAAAYSGVPAKGYQISSITVTPSEVTVSGSEEALQKLSEDGNVITIPGSMIALEHASKDFSRTLDLKSVITEVYGENAMQVAADNETTTDTQKVTVNVTILPIGSQEYMLDVDRISNTGLAGNLTVSYDLAKLPIRVKGTDENLAVFDVSQMVQASIDLGGKTAGDYELAVNVSLIGDYELVDQVTATVHLKEKGETTTAKTEG